MNISAIMTAVPAQNMRFVTEHMMYLAKMDTTDTVNHTMIRMILVVQNAPIIHIVLRDTDVKTDSVYVVKQTVLKPVQHVQAKHHIITVVNVFVVLKQQTVTETEPVQTMNV